jgi:hypothetical protein
VVLCPWAALDVMREFSKGLRSSQFRSSGIGW